MDSEVKREIKIGIKFCGNCNPHINPMKIYEKLKDNLPQHIKIIDKDLPEMEVLLVLSSCPVDCASRPLGTYKEITVAGETLNRYNCPAKKIPEKVINLLKNELER